MPAILITGRAGSGKSTIVREVIEAVKPPAGGFFSPDVRDATGERIGFDIVTLAGERAPLARVGARGTHYLGRYGVDIAALEGVGVAAIEAAVEAGHLVVIDEIGKMELFSMLFQRSLIQALRRNRLIFGTVMLSSHPFSDELKAQPDALVFEVTPSTRADVRAKAEAHLRAALGQFSV